MAGRRSSESTKSGDFPYLIYPLIVQIAVIVDAPPCHEIHSSATLNARALILQQEVSCCTATIEGISRGKCGGLDLVVLQGHKYRPYHCSLQPSHRATAHNKFVGIHTQPHHNTVTSHHHALPPIVGGGHRPQARPGRGECGLGQ